MQHPYCIKNYNWLCTMYYTKILLYLWHLNIFFPNYLIVSFPSAPCCGSYTNIEIHVILIFFLSKWWRNKIRQNITSATKNLSKTRMFWKDLVATNLCMCVDIYNNYWSPCLPKSNKTKFMHTKLGVIQAQYHSLFNHYLTADYEWIQQKYFGGGGGRTAKQP